MEAAQLAPDDGERPGDPGALEAGDTGNETTCHDGSQGSKGNQGPCDHGTPSLQSTEARDSSIWSDETPGAEGSRSLGAGNDEGSRSRGPGRDEGSRSPGDEGSGSLRAGNDEGSGGLGAGNDEGSGSLGAGNDEGSGGLGAGNDEGSGGLGAGNDEGSGGVGAGNDEGSGGLGAGNDEGSGGLRAGNDERSGGLRAGNDEGSGTSRSEGSRNSRTWGRQGCGDPKSRSAEGPETWSDETARGPRSAFSEGTSPISNEEPGDAGAISISEKLENSIDGAHEEPNDSRDSSTNQWLPGPSGSEKTGSAWTCNDGEPSNGSQGPNAVTATKFYDAKTQDPTERPQSKSRKGGSGSGASTVESSSEGTESFKKPIAPSRPGRNEKILEQHDKPSSTSFPPQPFPPIGSHGETGPDDCAKLPSDAYRASPAIPYREPAWSGLPQALYSLEMLKGGSILSTKSLNGASWTVFGRLPTCHVPLEHPSVSRYHAVLQYRSVPGSEPDEGPGFYVYDLGSTHGTFINKQRIQSKTYCRLRVGHVLKFGGSTRLFILQGPDEDQEEESELTVTQIKEARRQKEKLQKRMMGDDSDEEDNLEEEEAGEEKERKEQGGSDDTGCSWGMGEDAPEEETDENPIAMEFLEDREALYSRNPKKALQGFFDREGEELEFEYEERGIGSWLCKVKLPADDSSGKQLVAEVVHSGKKRDAMKLCSLEACRMLDMRGLLRQEAVSRKRKAKQWEDEDFYDSDDDTFLDRTGVVEKKRLNRMKKAGKIEEKPETYESLTAKLDVVEKEIVEIAAKLKTNQQGEAQTSAQDSLDAFMTEIKSGASLDSVTRKKLHLQSLELKKEQLRLKSLIKIVQPTRLPELRTDSADSKTKKLTLPMFGAMKGGSKFKLKTGTVGKLPPKRTELPSNLFTMKGDGNEPEEEEDEEDDVQEDTASRTESNAALSEAMEQSRSSDPGNSTYPPQVADVEEKIPTEESKEIMEAPSASRRTLNSPKPPASQTKEEEEEEEEAPGTTTVKLKKMLGPSRPPRGALSSNYPKDDPDYCVWTPPAGQTGDGKTHLNEKYGY
ncbi:kanadaptin [Rhinoderma darwinii]|uniref:kanadaptin n=1 Tax=Rhinoderma darwinii TaxID=43563 RepID=UPI003F67BBF2